MKQFKLLFFLFSVIVSKNSAGFSKETVTIEDLVKDKKKYFRKCSNSWFGTKFNSCELNQTVNVKISDHVFTFCGLNEYETYPNPCID